MDVLEQIKFLMKKNNWSEYKLAKISGIPQSTINSMFKHHNNPSIYTLECICKAFNMSVSDFFLEIENQHKTINKIDDQLILEKWNQLTPQQQEIILSVINSLINK